MKLVVRDDCRHRFSIWQPAPVTFALLAKISSALQHSRAPCFVSFSVVKAICVTHIITPLFCSPAPASRRNSHAAAIAHKRPAHAYTLFCTTKVRPAFSCGRTFYILTLPYSKMDMLDISDIISLAHPDIFRPFFLPNHPLHLLHFCQAHTLQPSPIPFPPHTVLSESHE